GPEGIRCRGWIAGWEGRPKPAGTRVDIRAAAAAGRVAAMQHYARKRGPATPAPPGPERPPAVVGAPPFGAPAKEFLPACPHRAVTMLTAMRRRRKPPTTSR